jgi:cephalosporin hydroxylase
VIDGWRIVPFIPSGRKRTESILLTNLRRFDPIIDEVQVWLNIYAPLTTAGQYCVIEDTFLGFWDMTEGETEERFRAGSTWHALQRYLADHPELVADHDIEPYITMTPSGWLCRA